jgi:hypothetical protein
VSELQMRDPAQYAKLMAPFSGGGQFGITSMPMGGGAQSYGQPLREGGPQGSAASRNTKFDTYSTPAAAAARAKPAGPPTRQQAGYSGVKDMFDGGGPRASSAKKGKK